MKKIISIVLVLFCLTIGLIGCDMEPKIFGMPQSQWNTLTKEQQQAVINGYNRRKMIEEQNRPLTSAVSTAGEIMHQHEFDRSFHHMH